VPAIETASATIDGEAVCRDDAPAWHGLIAAGIVVAIIAVVQGLGTNLQSTFSTVSVAVTPAS
jgi:Flp pilus assembly pilin Flp